MLDPPRDFLPLIAKSPVIPDRNNVTFESKEKRNRPANKSNGLGECCGPQSCTDSSNRRKGIAVSGIESSTGKQALGRFGFIYGLTLATTIGCFVLICSFGERLQRPVTANSLSPTSTFDGGPSTLFRVLVALTAVIVLGNLLAKIFRLFGQPPVIGEVFAGILLGPSLLGAQFSSFVLPLSVAPFLAIIAQLGVTLYMFLVGLELNARLLQRRVHVTIAVSHASILAPFLLGGFLSLFLYTSLATEHVPFLHFALFLGVAMSVTAFPVLARILADRGWTQTELGAIALSCAAVDDVTAWCLLALAVGVAKASLSDAFVVTAGTLAYIIVMFLVVRPLARRAASSCVSDRPSHNSIVVVFAGMLLSCLITEAIGIHAIFGAFLFGAVMPHESSIAKALRSELEDVVTILLLPAFFAFTGMRTRIDLVTGLDQWLLCGLIIIVASLGKFGGTLIAARLTGLGWRHSATLGVLMNTRGLMELIVLNIGLEMNVISPRLFAMMVLMALATTLATSPILRCLWSSTGLEPVPANDASEK